MRFVKRVIVAGYGELAYHSLRALLDLPQACEVLGFIPWMMKAGPFGWLPWQKSTEAALANLCEANRLPHWSGYEGFNSSRCQQELLQRYQPDVVLIASWGEVIKKQTFAAFPSTRFINTHPSLLPAHRGANPYISVIRQREAVTGVTFHRMLPRLDAGPILCQARVEVTPTETSDSLRDKCGQMAGLLTPELVKVWDTPGTPQDESKASYFDKAYLGQCELHWYEPPEALDALARAVTSWFSPVTYLPDGTAVEVGQLVLMEAPASLRQAGKALLPGTVVQALPGQLWVQSSNPEVLVFLSQMRIWMPTINQWLPVWPSSQAILRKVQAGQQLASPALSVTAT